MAPGGAKAKALDCEPPALPLGGDPGVLASDVSGEVEPVRVTPRSRPCGLQEPEVHAALRVAGEWKRGLAARSHPVPGQRR